MSNKIKSTVILAGSFETACSMEHPEGISEEALVEHVIDLFTRSMANKDIRTIILRAAFLPVDTEETGGPRVS